jgi:hypothetical protein
MTNPIKKFLAMTPEKQMIYRGRRRTDIFFKLNDLNNPELMEHVEVARTRYDVTVGSVDEFTDKIMKHPVTANGWGKSGPQR